MPTANYYRDDDFEIVRKTISTKASGWKHEREWRWVLVGKAGVARLGPNVVTSVSFGLRTPDRVQKQVFAWIRGSGRPIEVRRAILDPKSYAIRLVPA